MDSYSYISENGNIRQIIDLIAQEKNDEQDERITNLENKTIQDIYSTTETKTNKIWINGKPIYRIVKEGTISVNNANWSQITFFNDNVQKQITKIEMTNTNTCLRIQNINITNTISVSTATSSGNGSSTNCQFRITLEYTKATD